MGLYKSRGTQFSPTGISNGDYLGYITGYGVDTTGSYAEGAQIYFQSSSSWNPSDHSSEIIFYSVPAGATAAAEDFRMGSNADAGDATANISYLNMNVGNSDVFGWSSSNGDASPDTALSRLTADTVAVGNGTEGDTSGTLVAAKIEVGTTTAASLPSCTSSIEGEQRAVVDSNTVTWGATLAGGGSNHILAYCDGTSWTVMAK